MREAASPYPLATRPRRLTLRLTRAGVPTENLYGMCESMYKPDQEPDDLFETVAQCLLSAVDRDALSGWGGVVHVIEPNRVTKRILKGRQD